MKLIKFLFTLISIGISAQSFGGSIVGHEKDPYEKTFITNTQRLPDQNFQEQLRQSPAWQHFLASHPRWSVMFNEENQKPHRAYGQPFSIMTGTDAKSAALNFIQNSLNEFNIPVNELKYQTSNVSKYQNVFFTQTHNGLEVLFSNFMVKMTLDNKVISWGGDVFDNMQVDMNPAVNEATAKNAAALNIPLVTNVSGTALKILPVPADQSYDFHLVYELTVSANIPGSPAEYYTLVDAHSGEILYRTNLISFATPLNTDVNVAGTLYKTSIASPSSVEPLKNLKVVANSTTYYTDSLGNAAIPGSSSQSATFSLQGKWSKVTTDQGTTVPSLTQTLGVGSNTVSFDTTTQIQHLSGYYHVNIVHDFMKQFFPAFTSMDFALPTKIDVTGGSCNAFYGNSKINFYASGSGCNCMAVVGDIVYHEYGHGINSLFYQSQGGSWSNGSMGEGYADVWALSITKGPLEGEGYRIGQPGSYIRRYDIDKKVYPQNLTGEVHDNGEIIAGAWYDVSLNLGSWLDMTTLFTQTYYDLITAPNGSEGQLYVDILLSALQHDDNDGDLSNGTPHFKQIIDAFALHGISLTSNTSITHSEILSAVSGNPIPVNVDMTNSLPYIGANNLHLYYRTDSVGAWTTLPMSLSSGITYTASVPAQPSGTIIRYYVELVDTVWGVSKILPAEANTADPNIPYFILVGYYSAFLDGLEDSVSAWTAGVLSDTATSGKWIIAKPVSSLKTGVVVQPGTQHTPGGLKCAITGNANPVSSMAAQDIDKGQTTLISPTYDISTYNQPLVSFWRWYTNDQGGDAHKDFWQVYASADGVNYVPVEYIDVPDHSYRRFVFRVEDVLPGATQITLKFIAEDANVETIVEAAVDDIEFLNLGTVGITEHTGIAGISAYPNPAKDQLNISIPALNSKSDLRIFNSIGDLVFEEPIAASGKSSVRTISVKDFASGVYHITMNSKEGVSHLNVIVQH